MDKKYVIGLIMFIVIVGGYFVKTQIDLNKKYPLRHEDKPNYDIYQSINYNMDSSIRNMQFAIFFMSLTLLIGCKRRA